MIAGAVGCVAFKAPSQSRSAYDTTVAASTTGRCEFLALNADEGWSRDVSEAISAKVRDVAAHEGRELTSGTLAFIEAHIGRVKSSQPCHCGE
jgi:hypothetical protein